ncbi:MAG TPA: DoxX family protein [Terriglobales bacterium]|nr:DoxX family protein [Terriglobales bacterium]
MRRFSDIAYLLMRVVVGFLFACHGAQKLFGVLGGRKELHDLQGFLAGVIEFGAGIAVAIGFFSAIAAFIASGEMAVAYFKAHAARGFWPILNRGELAVLYCFIFLYISTQGDGSLGFRKLIQKRTPK